MYVIEHKTRGIKEKDGIPGTGAGLDSCLEGSRLRRLLGMFQGLADFDYRGGESRKQAISD